MHVIGHDAPGPQGVTLPVKVPNGIRDNFGDPGIAQMACSQPAIEGLLGLLQDRAEFAGAGLVGGRRLEAGATSAV